MSLVPAIELSMSWLIGLALCSLVVVALPDEQIFRWCRENEKCTLAYHIDTNSPHARDTFLYLLRLRANIRKGGSLTDTMMRSYGFRSDFVMNDTKIIQAHWMHFMLSQTPYCHTCADSVPQEAGVECGHGRHQLVYNASSKALSCREKGQQQGDDAPPTERFHTSMWTDIAVGFLCAVLIVYGITKSIQFSLRIREYSKSKPKK